MKYLLIILTRLIQIVHWYCFLVFSFFIVLFIWDIITGASHNESITIIFFKGDDDSDFIAITIWIALIMPLIRYIIFRKFGWFPWTSFTKEEKIREKVRQIINTDAERRETTNQYPKTEGSPLSAPFEDGAEYDRLKKLVNKLFSLLKRKKVNKNDE